MADNLGKRPSKGILKNSSSFDKPEVKPKKAKETKWDEMNIIATLHPADKDYGHMKIDEPPTPYSRSNENLSGDIDELDADELAQKIRSGASKPPKFMDDNESDNDEDEEMTPEGRAKHAEFLAKRKQHYNEFSAAKLAKKKMEEEDDDDSDDDSMQQEHSSSGSPSPPPSHAAGTVLRAERRILDTAQTDQPRRFVRRPRQRRR